MKINRIKVPEKPKTLFMCVNIGQVFKTKDNPDNLYLKTMAGNAVLLDTNSAVTLDPNTICTTLDSELTIYEDY